MPIDPMHTGLRRLLGARASSPDLGARDRLEQRLVTTVSARDRAGQRSNASMGWILATRLAVGAAVAAAVTVGACQVPTEVDVELGLRVVLEVAPGPDAEARLEQLGANLEQVMTNAREPGAKHHFARVEMRVLLEERQGEAPRMAVTIDMWAPGLDEVLVVDTITETLPRADVVDVHRVEGAVHTTVGDRFAHELFDAELDEANVEEARARILADLEARGLAEGAQVEVVDEGGQRKVEVRVRHQHEEPGRNPTGPRHERPSIP